MRLAAPKRPWSIPACAGEPVPCRMPSRSVKVYPRVCGGTFTAACAAAHAIGLSPRVRGNPCIVVAAPSASRSIPACAGEPHTRRVVNALKEVYPRVCGGTYGDRTCIWLSLGLSPRVRGNLVQPCQVFAQHGSIPACAGEPFRKTFTASTISVYPRVCGGTPQALKLHMPMSGLSPRVWGNPAGA